jgi:SAM-dependent methyltransferase
MTALVTGHRYVEALSVRGSDRRRRDAFQALAVSLAPPASHIFDFGCGPGIDARSYAERGFAVSAFDVDPQMCEYFATHCAVGISRGRIRLAAGSYSDFLTRGNRIADVALVTANFAPLNLIADLASLLSRLHSMLMPRGCLLVSVLNPWYIGDARYGWWWRGLPSLLHSGAYRVQGAQAPIERRTIGRTAELAAQWFELDAVYSDMASSRGSLPQRLPARPSLNRLRLTTSKFVFLSFVKRD